LRTAVARRPVNPQARQSKSNKVIPAPVRGWVANESLAAGNPGSALVLENFWPTQTGVRLRGGSRKYATLTRTVVTSFLIYDSAQVRKLFAVSAGIVFDITRIIDPNLSPTVALFGRQGQYYSSTMFSTAGGNFLVAVNGVDPHVIYDGTAWAVNSPEITGVSSSDLNHVWSYRSRLFFVQKASLKARYLPVDSIGGAASELNFTGVFRKGGYLLFGATWSVDAGDGQDDKCVFVTNKGEVAIYEGANPSSAADWNLIGVYDISAPLGPDATIRAGGDLLIATVTGVVPLSVAMQKDPAALSLSAVSRAIEPEWPKAVNNAGPRPWQMAKINELNMGVVSVPGRTYSRAGAFGTETFLYSPAYTLVVNLETGAWAKYVGWDVQSVCSFDGKVFFGTSGGKVLIGEQGASDDGQPYVCRMASTFESMDSPRGYKQFHQARATWKYNLPFIDKVSASTDYNIEFPTPPAPLPVTGSRWDVGLWDTAIWDDNGAGQRISDDWVSIGRSGYAASINVQVTCSGGATPDAELILMDLTYENGEIVV
jgi:hypothetical protein